MATVQHRTLPDSEIHEPKGIVTAPNNSVYKSQGGGTGQWSKITPNMLQGVSGNGVAGQPVTVDGNGNFTLGGAGSSAVLGFGRANRTNAGASGSIWTLSPNTTDVVLISNGVALTASGIKVNFGGIYQVSLEFGVYTPSGGGEDSSNFRIFVNNTQPFGYVQVPAKASSSFTGLVRLNPGDEIRIGPAAVPSNTTPNNFYYSVVMVGS